MKTSDVRSNLSDALNRALYQRRRIVIRRRDCDLAALVGLLRTGAGHHRIVYAIEDETLCVSVVRAGHRRDVYRKR
jgi:mRNA-degrading endonuclease RelE of RelBE toxin-antitoxin system